ncbi:MAG: hypothetical protein EXS22_04445 [Pedosphaera sp.]|nr:hypothetical protein [Pedosphaera sp.]
MDLKFPCPSCNLSLTVDASAAGQSFPCPECGNEVDVPFTAPAPPAQPAVTQRRTMAPPPFRGVKPPPREAAAPTASAPAVEDDEADLGAPQRNESQPGYSAGFLARVLDRRLLWIKSRTIGTAFDTTARKIKVVGDICLLLIAGAWLGQSLFQQATGASATGANNATQSIPSKAPPAKVEKAAPPAPKADNPAAQIFAKQIEPVLKARCYECHGPDKKSKKLNLAVRDLAGDVRGILGVVDLANAENSVLLKRVLDKGDPMPPKEKGAMLKVEEVEALRTWIKGGAPAGAAAGGAGGSGDAPGSAASSGGITAKTILAIGKALLTGLLVIFLVLVIHYVTGRFFDANDSVIAASTPSRISSATVPNALAVLFWILALAILIAAVVKAATMSLADIKANWFAGLLNLLVGAALFAFALALARLFVADDFLNIKASQQANAGDEALGILSLLIKVGLKMAPVYYGLCLVLGCLFINLDRFWPAGTPPAAGILFGDSLYAAIREPGISLAGLGIETAIPTIVTLPVKAYFVFLVAFLAVEFARAVLNMSRKLGSR